jgi:glycosyltransferase involved in cell wall biosynthesis
MTDRLLATVVIPMRNEQAFIVSCLESLLANEAPGTIEFLVYDGRSTDRSRELVGAIADADPRVVLVDNPRRLQAAAFNEGFMRARGKYYLRADAHSVYPPNYVSECIRLLEETGAANVGGIQEATGVSWISSAIAAALSSRFAVGDAKYRYATRAEFTDTVYLGSWRTETLRQSGGMREDWAVNEDYELNVRLRAAGGKVFLSPTIRSTYFVRGSLAALVRQYVRYGFWKIRTLMEHQSSLRWRQIIAPAFVLSLLAAWPMVHRFGWLGASHLILYGVANLAASIATASRASWRYLPILPLIFLIVHVAWGAGFLAGLCYWPLRRPQAT